jgi:hypothetical protein
LVGGVASLLALFAGVGLTADRLAVVFNGGRARTLLIAALLCAVASIGFGLGAIIWKKPWLAAGAVLALVGSLAVGVVAASYSFSDGGRPTLTKVSVEPDGDKHAMLSFTVTADGVMKDNLLRVFAMWEQTNADPQQDSHLYVATLRPNDKGVVSQEVSLLINRPRSAQKIQLGVDWSPRNSERQLTLDAAGRLRTQMMSPQAGIFDQCGVQDNQHLAIACAEAEVVGAMPPTATK